MGYNFPHISNVGSVGKQKIWGLLQPMDILHSGKSWYKKETIMILENLISDNLRQSKIKLFEEIKIFTLTHYKITKQNYE